MSLRVPAVVIVVVALTSLPVAGQTPSAVAKPGTAPRVPWGDPDLQGFWDANRSENDVLALNIQGYPKNDGLVGTLGGPSIIVDPPDGRIPYQPWAAAKRNARTDRGYVYTGEIDPHVRCVLMGVPRQVYTPNGFQILQTPRSVVILGEVSHNYRVIPIDSRPHLGKDISMFMGDSRGRWEGDTLVVDVTNLNAKFWLDLAGDFVSDAVHIIERWTLVDADTLAYEATLEDPNVFTRPWKIGLRLARNRQEGFELIEHACHEGERDHQRILSAREGK